MKNEYTFLAFREIQIKTIVRYHFTPTRMANNKKDLLTTIDKDVEKLDHLPGHC